MSDHYPSQPGWRARDTSRAAAEAIAPEAKEEWRPIPGYEREYEASNLGRIRSLRRIITNTRNITRPYGGKVLVQNTFGPMALVTLSKHNHVTTHSVHALVCVAFHGPKPADKALVAHWDGDPLNNRAENLRWATHRENEDDKRRHGREASGERNPAVKLTTEQVAEIRRRYVKKYGAVAALAREFGVSSTQICDIVKGRCWSDEGNRLRREARAAAKGLIVDSGARGCAMGGRRAIVWQVAR